MNTRTFPIKTIIIRFVWPQISVEMLVGDGFNHFKYFENIKRYTPRGYSACVFFLPNQRTFFNFLKKIYPLPHLVTPLHYEYRVSKLKNGF